MTFKKISYITLLVSCVALSACTSKDKVKDPLTADRPAEEIFRDAQEAQKEGNYTKASTLYAEVERQHPYSDLATESQMRQAVAAYDALKYDEAIIALDRFIELHPGHDKVPYAFYLKALCYYEQMTDIRRDQSMSQQALEALDVVINRFPESEYSRDAKLKRDLVMDHLAGKEMEIGRYYLKQREFNAAINRFQNVVKNFQTTTHSPEALHRLVECYMSLGLKEEATRVAAVLGHNYPGSRWYQDSYALLEPASRSQIDEGGTWLSRSVNSLLKPD